MRNKDLQKTLMEYSHELQLGEPQSLDDVACGTHFFILETTSSLDYSSLRRDSFASAFRMLYIGEDLLDMVQDDDRQKEASLAYLLNLCFAQAR
jgi:hypothetical protein